MSELLKIGMVAKRTGVTVDTIRFYEKEGLLRVPLRSEGGFRIFDDRDVEDLRLIRSAQTLGFSLEEIRSLLSVRNGISMPCENVRSLLERKLTSIQQQISTLMSLEQEIRTALDECDAALRKHRSVDTSCPVLDVRHSRPVRKK